MRTILHGDPSARVQHGDPTAEPPELHIVRKSQHPIALCGARVSDEFNPARTDTAGRDRCSKCLFILRDMRKGCA